MSTVDCRCRRDRRSAARCRPARREGCGRGDGVDVAGEVQVDVAGRLELGLPPPVPPPFTPNTGPSEGSRSAATARRPRFRSPIASATDVVVLPSPAGVGLMAVTSTRRPRGWRRSSTSSGIFGLVATPRNELVRAETELLSDGRNWTQLHDRLIARFSRIDRARRREEPRPQGASEEHTSTVFDERATQPDEGRSPSGEDQFG